LSGISKYLSVKRSVLFMVAGLAAFVIYLYFYIGIPKIINVLDGINSVNYAIFYSLALISVLASVFFWSTAWNNILRSLSVKISYRKAYLYYWVGYFSDLVLPCATICGELTRLYLVQKQTDKDYGVLAASAVTNRIVAYTIVTIGLYSGGSLIFLKPGVSPVITNIFIVFLFGVTFYLAVLLYLAFVKHAARNFALVYQKIQKTFRPKHYSPYKELQTKQSLENYYSGFKIFREKPRLLIKPFILHLLSYFFGISVYILIFYAIGIPSSIEFYVVVYFIATAIQDAAASFSVGSLEIILTSIFLLYGMPLDKSFITALLVRSAGFWFPLFVGFLAVQVMGARNLIAKSPELKVEDGKVTLIQTGSTGNINVTGK
jgi:uncharacterized protein (TIRG00374 family)